MKIDVPESGSPSNGKNWFSRMVPAASTALSRLDRIFFRFLVDENGSFHNGGVPEGVSLMNQKFPK